MMRFPGVLLSILMLAGCQTRPRDAVNPPAFTASIADHDPAMASVGMYPPPPAQIAKNSSLWRAARRNLYSDIRAFSEGDIVTVLIDMKDEAKLRNQTGRSRSSSRDLSASGSFDINGAYAGTASGQAALGTGSDFSGDGSIARSESIRLSVAATVARRLENGNLVIRGSQEIRVNSELRMLTIVGVVRTSDISPSNTVPYDRIADARISYGGKGRLSEVQQPPLGVQLLDVYSPF